MNLEKRGRPLLFWTAVGLVIWAVFAWTEGL